MEDLSDDVSLQAADDVSLAETFGGAPGHVVDCGLMKAHTDDDGAIDSRVQLPVTAVVDAMATRGHPGGRRDRLIPASFARAPSDLMRSGLSPTTMRIFTSGVGPDAERLHELRGGSENESLDHRLQLRCLSVESDPAPTARSR